MSKKNIYVFEVRAAKLEKQKEDETAQNWDAMQQEITDPSHEMESNGLPPGLVPVVFWAKKTFEAIDVFSIQEHSKDQSLIFTNHGDFVAKVQFDKLFKLFYGKKNNKKKK